MNQFVKYEKPRRSKYRYVLTGKKADPLKVGEEAPYFICNMVKASGPKGTTAYDLHNDILRAKGLSFSDAEELLHNAEVGGYLQRINAKGKSLSK